MQPASLSLWIWPCLMLMVGCGEAMVTEETSIGAGSARVASDSAPSSEAMFRESMALGADSAPGESATMPEVDPAVPRKIIYNAEVGLVVEDFASAADRVTELVEQFRGYIADFEILGSPGQKRSARWRVRVPVEAFESFLRDVAGLGEIEKNSRTSEDVTERFYDLQARIKNKEVEERRLQQILEERTGVLEDVLKVEKELSRVRGELEQMQGTLRLLDNLSSLTTVTINIRERADYNPPPPIAASFSTKVSRAFFDSLAALISVGEALILFLVRIVLWVPLIALLILPFWIGLRRRLRAQVRPGPGGATSAT